MPELPEVETVRDGLDRFVVGAVVRRVEVLRDYSVRRHEGGAPDFAGRLTGRRLAAAVRRGKFLWLPLVEEGGGPAAPPDEALLAHLGMSGQLLVRGGTSADEWQHPHLRVRLHLEGAPGDHGAPARYLDFVDQRTFGHLSVQDLVPDAAGLAAGHGSDLPLLPVPVEHIARDLLDPHAERVAVARAVRRRRTQIKRALLDQTVVSGVGNIYADEALWRAEVHGRRPVDRMRQGDVLRVLDAAAEVMGEALVRGGTSFDALYVNVNGESGYFARNLDVYGRAGEPCRRCGTAIRREQFMNRSSYFCPRCQRFR
ncbi:bifunctional DNA-formamidopyrimidine glycosylase/DNA-(apurinic or apyrimidinic site) lyase [Myceligenerans salitolerans]|uniref:Bifunctional DNA-formamidopyrimidine glycosylase/DNA-(Apurinic or apyrimidinic site) lyase n=1 Tax=Myceligenerans salitolerans TaxID=1230528 RepID=A0ABS3I3T8_9MICO|nr:bifunctional DNA-formamidopyrimidine glycosylase/DNA-(apurinic or apyrimidinic site) lyase [Myceligenerans salitolerans]MBO0607640.1 bifunctional DNA-formamidopyrimidine glycosylase/DNA-(apurinic or apyrimidinic site) lyase [Myceligenerans salitolerans]